MRSRRTWTGRRHCLALLRAGPGQTYLQVMDDLAELARGEEAAAKRARRFLTDRREGLKCSANLSRHVVELPADLVLDRFWPVRISEAGGFDCVSGGTQRVRAHVADGDGLTGGLRSGHGSRRPHVVRTDAPGKATADLLRGAELSPGERMSSGDESARAVIVWGLSLKEVQNPLRAVGSPCGNKASVGFAQRLWRCHNPSPPRPPGHSRRSSHLRAGRARVHFSILPGSVEQNRHLLGRTAA
jgi:hypothetical protein